MICHGQCLRDRTCRCARRSTAFPRKAPCTAASAPAQRCAHTARLVPPCGTQPQGQGTAYRMRSYLAQLHVHTLRNARTHLVRAQHARRHGIGYAQYTDHDLQPRTKTWPCVVFLHSLVCEHCTFKYGSYLAHATAHRHYQHHLSDFAWQLARHRQRHRQGLGHSKMT